MLLDPVLSGLLADERYGRRTGNFRRKKLGKTQGIAGTAWRLVRVTCLGQRSRPQAPTLACSYLARCEAPAKTLGKNRRKPDDFGLSTPSEVEYYERM